jgi:hypothetical protein
MEHDFENEKPHTELQTPLRGILKNPDDKIIDYNIIKQRLVIVCIILLSIVIISVIVAWIH